MSTQKNGNLLVISPTLPPAVCGVSDYSCQLLHELNNYYDSAQIGVEKVPKMESGNLYKNICALRWKDQLALLGRQASCADVILNYTPLSYNKFGFPFTLLRSLKKYKQNGKINRLFVVIHETWSGATNLKLHHQLKDQLIKSTVRQLSNIADGLVVMTPEQLQKLQELTNHSKIYLGLVGSNIIPSSMTSGLLSQRRKGQWIIFGLSHTRVWAIQTHLPFLKALYEQGRLHQIRTIGPANDEFGTLEQSLLNEHFSNGILMQLGALSPEAVSIELLAAEASITGQTADSLKKSGTFAALAAHGVPVVCKVEQTTSDPPVEALFEPDEILSDQNIFSTNNALERKKLLHAWFWNTRSWKAIAEDLHKWMSL